MILSQKHTEYPHTQSIPAMPVAGDAKRLFLNLFMLADGSSKSSGPSLSGFFWVGTRINVNYWGKWQFEWFQSEDKPENKLRAAKTIRSTDAAGEAGQVLPANHFDQHFSALDAGRVMVVGKGQRERGRSGEKSVLSFVICSLWHIATTKSIFPHSKNQRFRLLFFTLPEGIMVFYKGVIKILIKHLRFKIKFKYIILREVSSQVPYPFQNKLFSHFI